MPAAHPHSLLRRGGPRGPSALHLPCPRPGGQGALAGNQDRPGPLDRERLLLRLRPQGAVHGGGSPEDRGADGADRQARSADRASRDVQGGGAAILRGRRGAVQDLLRAGEGRRGRQRLPPGRVHGLLPGPAPPFHRQAPRVQAALGRRRLLARRRAQPDAAADLRDRLLHREGAGRAPRAARGGEAARPPQAGEGARPVLLPPGGPREPVLPPQGRGRLQPARRLRPRAVPAPRIPRGDHPPGLRRIALAPLGALRGLPGEHVLHRGGRARVRGQADELPLALPHLPRRSATPTASFRCGTPTSGGCTATSGRA